MNKCNKNKKYFRNKKWRRKYRKCNKDFSKDT